MFIEVLLISKRNIKLRNCISLSL